jgi:uncharacterized protein YegJ (DUF2314 family)
MSDWLSRKVPHIGAVWFTSPEPPGPASFARLDRHDIRVTPIELPEMAWGLELSHSGWGRARVACPLESPTPPADLTPFTEMAAAEKALCAKAKSRLTVALDAPGSNMLRERKHLFRFLAAVAGTDGVAIVEPMSMRLWTPAAAADELAHEADLDIEALYSVHAISDDDGKCIWVHTHGLALHGGLDVHLVPPERGLDCALYPDSVRALAGITLERHDAAAAPVLPLATPDRFVRLVPTDRVLTEGRGWGVAALRQLLHDDDGAHVEGHAVVCEPEALSWWQRLRGKGNVEVARCLWSREPVSATVLYTATMTALIEARARATYGVLRRLREEFASFEFPTTVKLGFETDAAAAAQREHLWFLVETCADDNILGSLENRPRAVSGLKEGDRARHAVDRLTDWVIHTPAGAITPRSQAAARMIREDPARFRRGSTD